MVRQSWIIGALAAALWIAPAAAQTGSSSQGSERPYAGGSGTDPTRSNTDTNMAPSTSREHERDQTTQQVPDSSGSHGPGMSGTGSSRSSSTDTMSESRTPSSDRSERRSSSSSSTKSSNPPGGWNGNNQQSGASENYPYSR